MKKLFIVANLDADYGEPENFLAYCEDKETAIQLAQSYFEEDYQKDSWKIEEEIDMEKNTYFVLN